MKRLCIALLVLCLAFVAGAANRTDNWTGWTDTVGIADTLDSAEVLYTDSLVLTNYENLRIIHLVSDTSTGGYGGFSGDSLHYRWGYQTGSFVLDSGGTATIQWDDRFVVDTVVTDSLGKSHPATIATDGTITRTWGHVDTSSVPGWAIQDRWVVPEWNVWIRFWVEGLSSAQNGDSPTLFRFQRNQRKFSYVREM